MDDKCFRAYFSPRLFAACLFLLISTDLSACAGSGVEAAAAQAAPPESAAEAVGPAGESSEGAEKAASLRITDEPKKSSPGPAVITFGGDIYFSDYVMDAYDAGGIGGILGDGLRKEIADSDLFFANEEFPFTTRGTAEDKTYTFRVDPERAKILTEIGADVMTLANNHILDYGAEGLVDTLETLDGEGISHSGADVSLEKAEKPVIFEAKGKKIGILAASRVYPTEDWAAGPSNPGVFSTYDPAELVRQIQMLRGKCDYLIVSVHWGIERHTEPEEYQRDLGHAFIDAGADLVVGSHPHVLQGIEYYEGKPILYSAGNFLFGSSIPKTFLAKVQLAEDGTAHLTLFPAKSSNGYTREIDETDREAFFKDLMDISSGVRIAADGQVTPE